MHIGENVREALDRHGITGRAVAERLKVGPTAVYGLCDTESPRLRTLRRYAEAMTAILAERGDTRRFTAESLLEGPDPWPPEGPVPAAPPLPRPLLEVLDEDFDSLAYFGAVPCGDPIDLAEVPAPELRPVLRAYLRRGMTADNTFLVTAAGASMAPTIQTGDLLLVRVDADWTYGSIVVANVSGAATVKRIGRGPDGGYMLLPDNHLDQPVLVDPASDTVEIVGVVKKVIREIDL